GVRVGRGGPRRAKVALPLDVPGAVELEEQRPGVLAGVGEAAGRNVATVSGLPDLLECAAVRAGLIHPRPGELARRVKLFHQGTRPPAERRATAARPAIDGPPGHHVPAVGGLLHRHALGIVTRRALPAGAP